MAIPPGCRGGQVQGRMAGRGTRARYCDRQVHQMPLPGAHSRRNPVRTQVAVMRHGLRHGHRRCQTGRMRRPAAGRILLGLTHHSRLRTCGPDGPSGGTQVQGWTRSSKPREQVLSVAQHSTSLLSGCSQPVRICDWRGNRSRRRKEDSCGRFSGDLKCRSDAILPARSQDTPRTRSLDQADPGRNPPLRHPRLHGGRLSRRRSRIMVVTLLAGRRPPPPPG